MEIARYRRKLSGPILDRLDMQIFVPEVEVAELAGKSKVIEENSQTIRERVTLARTRQVKRWQKLNLTTNYQLSSAQIRQEIKMDEKAQKILLRAVEKWQLSARSYFKLIKVARTIADLAPQEIEVLGETEVAEALQYRQVMSERV
jgi:magnesium chelatase family protein